MSTTDRGLSTDRGKAGLAAIAAALCLTLPAGALAAGHYRESTHRSGSRSSSSRSRSAATHRIATRYGHIAHRKPSHSANPTATIVTSMGPITVELFPHQSPLTVSNFIGLATGSKPWINPATGKTEHRPLYNGTLFHRVIPHFMIQGGDPLGNGRGGPGYEFKNENSPGLVFDKPGYLAMANAGPDTNGCQFFITTAPAPQLNGGYTIFGRVLSGQPVVDRISEVPRDENDRPLHDVVIRKIIVHPAARH